MNQPQYSSSLPEAADVCRVLLPPSLLARLEPCTVVELIDHIIVAIIAGCFACGTEQPVSAYILYSYSKIHILPQSTPAVKDIDSRNLSRILYWRTSAVMKVDLLIDSVRSDDELGTYIPVFGMAFVGAFSKFENVVDSGACLDVGAFGSV